MTLLLRQKFTPAASKQMALDLVERAAVVFLFVFFAVRMLPRLAQLIQLQVTYPELIVAAAGISAQALLLVVSEMLSVILILARQPAATSGPPSMRRPPSPSSPGIWTPWTSVRKVKEGETTNNLLGFLTTAPDDVVAPIHAKAMPVILTEPDDIETWLTAPAEEALKLQRPLPDGKLAIVARTLAGN